MAKKRKKKKVEGFDSKAWTDRELKQMATGETHIDKSGKWRSKKYRIPKWIYKHEYLGKSTHISFRKKYGRWANNEERILVSMYSYSDYTLKHLSEGSKIDYKNISRYLKSMEKKKLIEIKDDYKFKKQKSGKLKTYHTKEVRLAKKGVDLKRKILGYYV